MLAKSALLLLLGQLAPSGVPPARPTPEARAVAFLSREVPRWSRQKHCFSCHNNGDAARALFRAARAGQNVPEDALADTTSWLQKPADWDHNGGEGPFSDKRLARVAFTAALATAVSTGHVKDRSPLLKAAAQLALDQAADGSWPLEGEDTTGAPATYGRPLATLLARESLTAAEPVRFQAAIERADAWLLKLDVQNVTNACVSLLAIASAKRQPPAPSQARSLELIARAQSEGGGWGPDAFSPPEPFDTALALLALAKCEPTVHVQTLITRPQVPDL